MVSPLTKIAALIFAYGQLRHRFPKRTDVPEAVPDFSSGPRPVLFLRQSTEGTQRAHDRPLNVEVLGPLVLWSPASKSGPDDCRRTNMPRAEIDRTPIRERVREGSANGRTTWNQWEGRMASAPRSKMTKGFPVRPRKETSGSLTSNNWPVTTSRLRSGCASSWKSI